ncbi:MAG: lipase family protein [Spirochaetaceae bacterium]|nr:MAG: lipase family protein [Spirochaetaceae bacterium]
MPLIVLARRLSVTLALGIALLSCQSFPAGERLEEVIHEPGYSLHELSTYFAMGRSAWRVREEYQDRDWDLHYFGDTDTHVLGVAIPRGDTLYFAFRGSQAHRNRRDVRMNAMLSLRRVPYAEDRRIRAYRGFLVKYLAIREEMHGLIEEFRPERIFLVGHSGGGAMASLAFMDLYPGYPDLEVRVITFGMPRVFNRHGRAWFEEQEEPLLRIVNGRDIIVGLPPALFGYRHVGRLVRMGRRPLLPPFSFKHHWPGYHEGLEAMILAGQGSQASKAAQAE